MGKGHFHFERQHFEGHHLTLQDKVVAVLAATVIAGATLGALSYLSFRADELIEVMRAGTASNSVVLLVTLIPVVVGFVGSLIAFYLASRSREGSD